LVKGHVSINSGAQYSASVGVGATKSIRHQATCSMYSAKTE